VPRRSGPAARLGLVAAVLVTAACGATTAPRSAGPSGSADSSRAPGSVGPSTGHASVGPSPTANPSAAAIAAFVALVTKAGFSYQATFTGESRHTTDILPISKGLLQVHGDDVLVRATFTFPGGSSAVEHRFVKGQGWIRYDRSLPWQRLSMKADQSMAAFAAVHTAADVTYVKPVVSDGRSLYQVRVRSAIVNPVMIPASNLTETVLTSPTLTLLIDEHGRPVSGTAEIDGHGRVSGQLQEIVIDLTVAFTKIGVAVSISAP
jgi:hypothetical protein